MRAKLLSLVPVKDKLQSGECKEVWRGKTFADTQPGEDKMCFRCLNAFSRPRWHFVGQKSHPYSQYGTRVREPRLWSRFLRSKDSIAPEIPMNVFHRMLAAMFGSGGGIKK